MTSEHVIAGVFGLVDIRTQNAEGRTPKTERRTQNARSGACGVGRAGLGIEL